MTAPSLTVQIQGLGSVNADQLNTFEQTCDTPAQLRAFVGVQGVQVYLRGYTAPGDGGQGAFYWNYGAVNPVDDGGVTTIVPSGAGSGCWSRLSLLYPPIVCTASGSNALVLTPAAGQPAISSYQNGQQFFFIAPTTSTGNVTVAVLSNGSTLPAEPVYRTSAVQAGSANVVAAIGYTLTYFSSINGAPGFLLSGSITKATSSGATISPAGPASVSAYTMQGLAVTITPVFSGNLSVTVTGNIVTTDGTAGDGIGYSIYYGTGTPPSNGDAATGTNISIAQGYSNPTTVTPADVFVPFCTATLAFGLTLGTEYWFDLGAVAKSGTGASLNDVNMLLVEV